MRPAQLLLVVRLDQLNFGTLGTPTNNEPITVIATGLSGGLTLGAIDAGFRDSHGKCNWYDGIWCRLSLGAINGGEAAIH